MDNSTTQNIKRPDLFIFSGESSGDLHGEALLKSLYALNPHLNIMGVGGPRMRKAGLQNLLQMEQFQVMGFIDVFLAFPKIARHFYFLAKEILKANPKIVVFIDYPGFALRLEKYLKKNGFQGKITHYICPSIWAWGKKRIPLMENTLDILFSIFPFEKNYFTPTFRVEYIGHPLVSRIQEHFYKPLPWAYGKKVISLFPGSRKKEIARNLPLQLKALKKLLEKDSESIGAISLSQENFTPLFLQYLTAEGLTLGESIRLVSASESYELMANSFMALAKSGTVTLELALHKIPTVVIYGISALDLFIAKDLLRISLPFYCIVNISAQKEVFKELIGPNATEENLSKEAEKLFEDSNYRQEKIQLCQEVALSLGNSRASENAAVTLINLLTIGTI